MTEAISGMPELLRDLRDAPRHAREGIRAAVEKAAFDVKQNARDNLRALGRAREVARFVDYDVEVDLLGAKVSAEVGAVNKSSGRLAQLIEDGSPTGSSPYRPLQRALEAQEDDFLRGLQKALDDSLEV